MLKNFNWGALRLDTIKRRGPRFKLQVTASALALANLIVLLLYLFPPGGSSEELTAEGQRLRGQIAATRMQAARLKEVAGKVQTGSTEAADFEQKCILTKRDAYEAVIAEVQRMAKEAGMVERDGVFSEEPIEGTADLSVLNMTANYQGPYASLMKFLNQADHSPMLLMLDALQASPQKNEQISASIRFQAIVRDEPVLGAGGQQ